MSSLPPDPYKILGVSKDAQLPEIRSAHRKLVLRCHPDKVQDPTLKAAKQDEFQKVQQAYELLSDENERLKYDDNVKLAELRKEMAAKGVSANTSASRAPRPHYDVNIRTAEPRADSFMASSSYRAPAGAKMYSQSTQNSRSYDDDLHHRANSIFEEPRAARRATSYEKAYGKTTRQEEERERSDRDRDRDRRRRKDEDRERERDEAIRALERKEREKALAAERERERERERIAERKALEKAARRAAAEKEARKLQRKAEKDALDRAEKERDRERKQASADKARRKAYVEPYGADETYVAKEKKSSKKTKEEEKRSRSIPRDPIREEMPPPPPPPAIPVDLTKVKISENMMTAAAYMEKSRKGAPGLSRAQTFAGFEPPMAAPTPPAAAPFVAPPPPMPTSDEDVRRSKSRRSSDSKREKSSHKKSPAKESHYPQVVEASPTARPIHQFSSTHSSPMGNSPPKNLGRATTFDASYVRPPPGPARAQTFHYGIETDSRGRNRSRLHPQTYSEDSESEDDPRPRRSHRHRVDEPIPLDYSPRSTKYAVSGTRAVPVQVDSYYRDESPTRKYYDARPPLARESSAYSGAFPKVKTSARYGYEDVQYSNIPHRSRDTEFAY